MAVGQKTWSSEASAAVVLSFLGLCLAFGFFVLKAFDVRALRWSLNRSQTVCLVLGVALVHQDLSPGNGAVLMLSEAPAALAASAAIEAARRCARFLPQLHGLLRAQLASSPIPCPAALATVRTHAARAIHYAHAPLIPRAPPA